MTCQHFTHGLAQHFYTKGWNLRQRSYPQGQHLKNHCKLWAPTWKMQVGGLMKPAKRVNRLGFTMMVHSSRNRMKILSSIQKVLARFLLRDGNKVGAEVSPVGLEVFTYTDQNGHQVHALATVQAEREFLQQVPSKLLPLYVRMEQALAKSVGRDCRSK